MIVRSIPFGFGRFATAVAIAAVAAGPVTAQDVQVRPDARPVIVIDGVVLGGATQEESELLFAAIRTAIASVEVMKGPAAAELYGERAVHGAIVIRLRPDAEAADPQARARMQREIDVAATRGPRPLMIVDGVIVSGTGFPPDLLQPAMIERIEVVKGAAAAALYGERAGNGVVIVTTKRDRTIH